MDFTVQEHEGFRFRELSVLDAFGIPEVQPLAESATLENVEARNAAVNRKIGYVLSRSLVDADGALLYADTDAALAGIPCRQWGAAMDVFASVMEASGLYTPEGADPKNA
jgi:hypothetical protein